MYQCPLGHTIHKDILSAIQILHMEKFSSDDSLEQISRLNQPSSERRSTINKVIESSYQEACGSTGRKRDATYHFEWFLFNIKDTTYFSISDKRIFNICLDSVRYPHQSYQEEQVI